MAQVTEIEGKISGYRINIETHAGSSNGIIALAALVRHPSQAH